MRIAIIGAGVSGLVVAHLLDGAHQVVLFDASEHAGGHVNTVSVEIDGETHRVDTGFIVFNDRNYPLFERLLRRLSIDSQPSSMSFSVSDGEGDFEYSSRSLFGLFAKPAHLLSPSFHRMIGDVLRFQRSAAALISGQEDISLGEWLERERFSAQFVERLIIPQVSAVWSAEARQRWSFPARFLAEFFDNHGMLSLRGRPRWRTITGGAARYVQALIASFTGEVRLRTPIIAVSRQDDHVLVQPHNGERERFDQVVIATHSDQALAMLADATAAEREILGAIPYQENEAALHTDARMLPRRRRAWASWNYHLPSSAGECEDHRPAVTYHMNRLQSIDATREFCVTLNRTKQIDPSKLLQTITYAHPVYTSAGVAAQRRWHQISGRNRTHFCGAYWGWGFHEDGVRSGIRVAAHLGAQL